MVERDMKVKRHPERWQLGKDHVKIVVWSVVDTDITSGEHSVTSRLCPCYSFETRVYEIVCADIENRDTG